MNADYAKSFCATERAPFRRIAISTVFAAAGVSLTMDEGKAIAIVGETRSATRTEPMITARKDLICEARFSAPDGIDARFEDGYMRRISICDLDLPIEGFRWETIMALPTHEAITIEGVDGEVVPIDAASLRAIADQRYAAEITAEFIKLRGPLDRIVDKSPPNEWFRGSN